MQSDPFKTLGLSDEITRSIRAAGFTNPTPIQELAIPFILEGEDLIIEAQTGSGKTATFAWPLLQGLGPRKEIQALIISPTRELALQVTSVFEQFSLHLPRKVSLLTVIGGESISQQKDRLRSGVDIVVATPGRLLDLIGQKVLDIGHIKFLVLDEADKVLDLGFAEELDLILKNIPKGRQNLFLSATYPEKVMSLVEKISSDPRHLKVETTESLGSIAQRAILVNSEKRGPLLRHLIQTEKWRNALIFVSSKLAAHNLAQKLVKAGHRATGLHGDLTQPQRNRALADFKAKKIDFLVATDVAARGIDIEKLSLVINFDLPRSPADYIHRIGRTGRAGEQGLAVSFIGLEDFDHFRVIEKRAQIRLQPEEVPGFELVGDPVRKTGMAPVKGKRKSKKDKARESGQRST